MAQDTMLRTDSSGRWSSLRKNDIVFRSVSAALGLLVVVVLSACSMTGEAQAPPVSAPVSADDGGAAASSQAGRAEKTYDEIVQISKQSAVQVLIGNMQEVQVEGTGEKQQMFVAYGSGSGSIITQSGYVLTNSHVAQGSALKLIIFQDHQQTQKKYATRLVGKNDPMDLAIFKILSAETFTPVKFGRSGEVKKGDRLIVGGFPSNEGFRVREGTASVDSVGWGYPWGYGGSFHPDYLQAVGLIRGGNSGGPMFNGFGEQVGVCCGSNNFADAGHAIPIDTVAKRMPELFDAAGANGFELGMTVACIGPKSREVLGVEPGLPAASAGVKAGDGVVAVNGEAIEEGLDFYLNLIDRRPGEFFPLLLERDGAKVEVFVILAARETHPASDVEGTVNGLNLKVYDGQWVKLPDFSTLEPVEERTAERISKQFGRRDGFALRYAGFVKAPVSGAYTFYLAADDGGKLYIDDQVVVDIDGLHGVVGGKGYISLAAGMHSIVVEYMDYGGGDELKAYWEGPGFGQVEIQPEALYRKP